MEFSTRLDVFCARRLARPPPFRALDLSSGGRSDSARNAPARPAVRNHLATRSGSDEVGDLLSHARAIHERREDIPLLAQFFLQHFSDLHKCRPARDQPQRPAYEIGRDKLEAARYSTVGDTFPTGQADVE